MIGSLQVVGALTDKATAGSPAGACEGRAQCEACLRAQIAWPEELLLHPYTALVCNGLPESENRCVEAGYLKNNGPFIKITHKQLHKE